MDSPFHVTVLISFCCLTVCVTRKWAGLGTIPVLSRDCLASRRSPGTRQRHFDGINSKPHKPPENAHAAKLQSHHHGSGVVCRRSGAYLSRCSCGTLC